MLYSKAQCITKFSTGKAHCFSRNTSKGYSRYSDIKMFYSLIFHNLKIITVHYIYNSISFLLLFQKFKAKMDKIIYSQEKEHQESFLSFLFVISRLPYKGEDVGYVFMCPADINIGLWATLPKAHIPKLSHCFFHNLLATIRFLFVWLVGFCCRIFLFLPEFRSPVCNYLKILLLNLKCSFCSLILFLLQNCPILKCIRTVLAYAYELLGIIQYQSLLYQNSQHLLCPLSILRLFLLC